ncbi:MAG: mechanosensitive ion channel family protein, partial [Sulfitobacter geojensis]
MRLILLVSLLFSLLFGAFHAPVQAQGIPFVTGTKPAADEQSAKIEEIMRQAAENGVGVVVIDREGNLLQPDPPTLPAQAEGTQEGSTLMALQDSTVRFRAALLDRMLQLPAAFNEVLYVLRAASPDGSLMAFGKALAYSLLLFAAGVLFEREIYGKRLMRNIIVRRVRENPEGFAEKMPFLVLRFIVGVGGILVSMAVAYVIGAIVFGTLEDTAIQFTVTLINVGYFTCRLVAGLWRMILSPYLSQYRIPALSDRDANRLHRWLWTLAVFEICAILFGAWIAELGLNYDVYA